MLAFNTLVERYAHRSHIYSYVHAYSAYEKVKKIWLKNDLFHTIYQSNI